MKKILVPVDFSPCSYNALKYAKEMASKLGYSLKVVNIYTGHLSPSVRLMLQPGKNHHESVLYNLQNFVSEKEGGNEIAVAASKLLIETDAILAVSVASGIIRLTKEESIAMVVMGATGAGDVVDRLLGGVSAAVAQRAACPVILVPKDVSFQGFKSILYASNYESIAENKLTEIIQFGKQFQSSMHFVHVEDEDKYEVVENTIFDKIFEEEFPTFSFTLSKVKGKTPIEGLNNYAEENNIDLMVLVNRQRKNYENIFGKSLTKKLAVRLERPMMVLHLESA